MKLALFNCDMQWEDPEKNREKYDTLLSEFLNSGILKPDLFIFPEYFTTGFSISRKNAEPPDGTTYRWLKEWSKKLDAALLASIPVIENGKYFNRALFVTPSKDFYYDKRHLFSPAKEDTLFTRGDKRTIIKYKEFNIALQICYDLRFPVWSRNSNLSYDIMINVANWSSSRDSVIEPLCRSRAIENLSYFAFVNRKGDDPNDSYSGQRFLFDFKGNPVLPAKESPEWAVFEINIEKLISFREKFKVWKDADEFIIKQTVSPNEQNI